MKLSNYSVIKFPIYFMFCVIFSSFIGCGGNNTSSSSSSSSSTSSTTSTSSTSSSSTSSTSSSSSSSSSSSTGSPATVWAEKCQACHGAKGEGVDGSYALNFAKIQSTYTTQTALAEYIAQYMPFKAEGTCTESCATAAASHLISLYPAVSQEPPSCKTGGKGLNTCGPGGNESCCTHLPVPGGTFYRTYTNNGNGATGTKDPATVSSFRLDKYEMTVGRFRQYVNYLANGGTPPAAGSGKHVHLNAGKGLADSGKAGSFEPGWNSAWNSKIPNGSGAAAAWAKNLNCSPYANWTSTAGNNEMMPLTCLSWYEAHAFCIWDGGFLPSEVEWKYSAAGGNEHRRFAWGSADPGKNNKYAIYDCYYPAGQQGNCVNVATSIPSVGITPLGVGRWGQWDLGGNVWEWNIDKYGSYTASCTDCALLTANTADRVLPGGGFHTPLLPYHLAANRSAVNYNADTYRGDYGVGVRCARAP
jgi:formylglycine-generating enzyme